MKQKQTEAGNVRIVVKQIKEDGQLWMPDRMSYIQSSPVVVTVDPEPNLGLRLTALHEWEVGKIGNCTNYIPVNGRIEIYAAEPEVE